MCIFNPIEKAMEIGYSLIKGTVDGDAALLTKENKKILLFKDDDWSQDEDTAWCYIFLEGDKNVSFRRKGFVVRNGQYNLSFWDYPEHFLSECRHLGNYVTVYNFDDLVKGQFDD